nr:hypothetical protein [Tanacetum cinerariifolium]
MTSITSLCEMACQVVQKKLEEKQIKEERAANAKYWKLLVCYDDDDDEKRSDSLDDNIISGLPPGDGDCYLGSRRDRSINDNPIPFYDPIISGTPPNLTPSGESDFFLEETHTFDNSLPEFTTFSKVLFDAEYESDSSDDQSCSDEDVLEKIDFSESNEEFSSTGDDSFSFDKIDYVEASPPNSELVSLKVMEIVIPKVGGIKASNDNPIPFYDPIIPGTPPNLTPLGEKGDMLLFEAFVNDDHSFDFKTKSSSTSLNTLLEETNNFDNSLPEFTTFSKEKGLKKKLGKVVKD